MNKGELRRLARCMLDDDLAGMPGRLFHEPLDLTVSEAYELQGEVVRLAALKKRGQPASGMRS